ncbi:hypothetical protein GBK04_15400 [Cytophagaceae bacterium SJW1-29]|uniref:T9SS type A sorting domain-containing protein n=1 Tax=Salmonirosea aquatica TaxID=2654236 RepID=A0A7C9F9K1_9BACT|nr:hypothetical protein [Cytophagaceae bacterium SJW1-29]
MSGVPTSAGVFSVTVTATDNAGASVSTQFKLAVATAGPGDNKPPVVSRGIPDQTGRVGVAFAYEVDGGTFTDPDGTIAGLGFAGLPGGVTASGWRLSGVPTSAGVFSVTVTATDNAGAKVSTTLKLTVQAAESGGNQYPEVRRTIPDQTATVGAAFSYEISKETFVDPDGPIIDIAVAGLPGGVSQTDWRVSGVPTAAGVFTVTVTARDNRDLKVSTQFKLTVQSAGGGDNRPPVVSRGIPDQAGTVGAAFAYEVEGGAFTDPDGTIAAISFAGLPGGITASGWRVSGVPTSAGVFSVTVTATDNAGASVSTQFKLAVATAGPGDNKPPVVSRGIPDQTGRVGVAFAYEVDGGTFTDPDGTIAGLGFAGLPGGVTASGWRLSGVPTSAGVFSVTVTATDNAGAKVSTTLKLTVQAAESGGNQYPEVRRTIPDQTATVGAAFSYEISKETFVDPDGPIIDIAVAGLPGGVSQTDWRVSGVPTAAGVFTVTVTARDNRDLKVSTQFKLTVQSAGGGDNRPPVVSRGIPDQAGTVGAAFAYEVEGGAFTDPDGTIAAISFAGLPGGITASGWRVSGVPTSAGVFSVTVTATDNAGASVSTQFKLAVATAGPGDNKPPVVSRGIPDQTGHVDVAFAYEVPKETFTDPDGTIAGVSFAGLPGGVTASGWRLSGVPTASGVFSVAVTATDNAGAKVSTTLKMTILPGGGNNKPPVVARSIPDQSGTVGVAFAYEVSKETFSDPDGSIAGISFAGLPAGVTASGWRLSGAPTSVGVYTVKVTASDNVGAQVSTSFKLTILSAANQPPVVSRSIPDQSGTIGVAFAYEVSKETFTDPEGPIAGISFAGLPAGVTASGWRLSGVPTAAGVFTVTVTASDGEGAKVSTSFKLTVQAVQQDNIISLFKAGNFLTRRFVRDILEGDTLRGEEVSQTVNLMVSPRTGTIGSYSFNLSGPISTTSEDSSTPYGVFGDNGGVILLEGKYTLTVKSYTEAGLQGTLISQQVLHFVVMVGEGQKNLPPVLAKPPGALFAKVGKSYAYRLPDSTFVDPDGFLTSFTITSLPDGLVGDGTLISGTPTKKGEYTVNVRVTDNGGATAETTFRFVVSADNLPPVVNGSVPDQVAEVNKPFNYTLPENIFQDPDGTIVSVAFIGLPEGITNRGLTLSGVPVKVRENPIIVIATDNSDAMVQLTFNINVIENNRPPVVAKQIGDQLAESSADYRFIIPAGTFTDPDGSIVRYEMSGLPPGLTARGDTLSGRPTQAGEYILTVKAFDNKQSSVQLTFKLIVLGNRAPLVNRPITNQVIDSSTVYRFVIPAGTFVDPDGSIVRLEISGLPPGITAQGDTISGRAAQMGEFTVSVRAFDNNGASVQLTFKLSVLGNRPPLVAKPISDQEADINTSYRFVIPGGTFVDLDGRIIRVEFSGLPSGVTAQGDTISGRPSRAGQYTVSVRAYDDKGAAVQTTFKITIKDSTVRPTVEPIPDVVAIVGQVFTFDVKSYFKDEQGSITSINYASTLPPGITANGSKLSGNPFTEGKYTIKVVAKDNKGGTLETTFILKVEKAELRVLLYQMQQGNRKLIRPVANVDRMALDTLPPALNLFVESNANITSVTFIITSPMVQYTTDESAPFGLFGDSGSFPALAGTYTLNILGYRSTTLVASRSIQFTITKTTNSPGRLGVIESEVFSEIELWKPYPSPFVDRVKVQTAPQGYPKLHAVEVLSSEGKILPLPASNWTMDQALLVVDLSETITLPGVYLLKVTGEDGKQKTMRIVKAPQN